MKRIYLILIGGAFCVLMVSMVKWQGVKRMDTTQSAATRRETCERLASNGLATNNEGFTFSGEISYKFGIWNNQGEQRIECEDNTMDTLTITLDGQPTMLLWSNDNYTIQKDKP